MLRAEPPSHWSMVAPWTNGDRCTWTPPCLRRCPPRPIRREPPSYWSRFVSLNQWWLLYLNSSMSTPMHSTSSRKRATLLLVKVCVPEPMVTAVPELLHVYVDDLHVQGQESRPPIGQGLCPWTNGGCRTWTPPCLRRCPPRPGRKEPPSYWSRFVSLNQWWLPYLNSSMSTPIPSTSR